MSHTNGPWLSDEQGYIFEDDATGRTIAKIIKNDAIPRDPEQETANRHLITASPDLLDACIEALRPGKPDYELIRAAIDKALGRS